MHKPNKQEKLASISRVDTPEWDRREMLDVEKVLEKFKKLISTLAMLPQNDDCYSLIHQDAPGENLAINGSGRITLSHFFD